MPWTHLPKVLVALGLQLLRRQGPVAVPLHNQVGGVVEAEAGEA